APSSRFEARKYEEVIITTSTGAAHKGKMISLEGDNIALLPFPYWNVDRIRLRLDEVLSIELPERGRRAGKGFFSGFGLGFIVTGMIAGASSKYDEDYEFALGVSAGAGVAVGLVGLLIGGIRDAVTKRRYDFADVSNEEKVQAVRKIMGLSAS
ncbi:MAG: hypothetical protein JXE07_09205, partial [Candidatus Aminicenantes bacterium]|nr:hypothetical protein [Candidatus Aminicenantes bacterium]